MPGLRTVDRQLIELKVHEHGIVNEALDSSIRTGTPTEILKALEASHTEDEVRQIAITSLGIYMRPRF